MENVSFCTFPQKPDAVSQKQDLHIKLAPYVTAIVSLISVGASLRLQLQPENFAL